jgi:phosphatidylinositol alpha-1,6-mannosyltransferase
MIHALALLRNDLPDVEWVVIGDGSLRPEYEDLARRLGLESNVYFLGSVSDSERDAWLDRAHVFAMPSRLPPEGGGEGFGIAYLEAGGHELPVVCGRVGGALDAVVDGESGLLVDADDPRAVASALRSLLLNPKRADELGRAGAERARSFTWQCVANRIEELLIKAARPVGDAAERERGRA